MHRRRAIPTQRASEGIANGILRNPEARGPKPETGKAVRRFHPTTQVGPRAALVSPFARSQAKSLESTSGIFRYNPRRLENRTGQGRPTKRPRNGDRVQGRTGGLRAKEGPFAFTIRLTRRKFQRNCLSPWTARDSRTSKLDAAAGSTACDRPKARRSVERPYVRRKAVDAF